MDDISDLVVKDGRLILKDRAIGHISYRTIGFRPSQKQKGSPHINKKDSLFATGLKVKVSFLRHMPLMR